MRKSTKSCAGGTGTFYVTGSEVARGEKSRIYVNLKERHDRSLNQLDSMQQVREVLGGARDIKTSVEEIAMVGGGMRAVPIQVMVQGRDLDDLNKRTIAIKDELQIAASWTRHVHETGKQSRIRIDRVQAANFGVYAAETEAPSTPHGGEIVENTRMRRKGAPRRHGQLIASERQQPADTGPLVRSPRANS
jgi:multidrug efflux pump subunit AcrB